MISQDTIDFIESLPAGMLATTSTGCMPSIHEINSLEVTPTQIVGYVPQRFAGALEQRAGPGAQVAVVISRIGGDHRSVQLKGKVTSLEPRQKRPEVVEVLRTALIPLLAEMVPSTEPLKQLMEEMQDEPFYRLTVQLEEAYDQTPGPKAGSSVGGGK